MSAAKTVISCHRFSKWATKSHSLNVGKDFQLSAYTQTTLTIPCFGDLVSFLITIYTGSVDSSFDSSKFLKDAWYTYVGIISYPIHTHIILE